MNFVVHAKDTISDLERTRNDLSAAVRQLLGQLASAAYLHARATKSFKDRTGNLRNSIQRGERSPWALFVKAGGPGARYAKFVEEGTKAHEIRARRATFLRFEKDGEVVFRRRVFHPGTKPTRFMQSARNVAEALAEKMIEKTVNSALK